MFDDARMLLRFRTGLRSFLRAPLSLPEAEEGLRAYLAARDESFLRLLDMAVYQQPASPWLALLQAARIEWGDVQQLVRSAGLDTALARLYDAGVYLTLPEMRGKEPLTRNGLELRLQPEDLGNPVLPGAFHAVTGGSTGRPRRLLIDFALLEHDVQAQRVFLNAFHLEPRPMAIWRPIPPGAAGLKRALLQARCGVPPLRWFSQADPSLARAPLKSRALLQAAVAGARRAGMPIPQPEFVPLENAALVADWLSATRLASTPAHLDTMVSSAIRVCQAARETGRDISGTFVRVGSEALTDARAAILRAAGLSCACHYSMSETGPIGMACADPHAADDVHLLSGKIAILPRPGDGGGQRLFLTTTLTAAPRILINVESGDAAMLETRACGCPFGRLGYQTHLYGIRSYEKVSGEGMYFPGAELAALVEEVLPGRFGGAPTDYQFVHQEVGGLNRVRLIISDRVGPLDAAAVRREILERLAAPSRGDRMKSALWAGGDVLTIERGEPAATPSCKIPAVRFVGQVTDV